MLTRNNEAGFAVIPAVDLVGEEVVRLEQGEFDRVVAREADPEAYVRRLVEAGARLVHVVDLDGARSGRPRLDLVRRLVEAAEPAAVQASGGVRSLADAERLLEAGASRIVVGTAAFAEPEALERFASTFGDRLVIAVDIKAGQVAVGGWRRQTGLTAEAAAERCAAAGAARLLCTAVERDGTLGGPDLDLLRRVRERSGLPVLAAGGVRSRDDLDAIEETGCEGAIVGRALLEARLPLAILAGAES
jgi:phosphoribosylformimino-5-aminoimidazole carboxamide ribotide isomerase